MKKTIFISALIMLIFCGQAFGVDVMVYSDGVHTVHMLTSSHFGNPQDFIDMGNYANSTQLPVLHWPNEGDAYLRFNETYIAVAGITGTACEFDVFESEGFYDLPLWTATGMPNFSYGLLLSVYTDLAEQNTMLMKWAFDTDHRPEQIAAIQAFANNLDLTAPEITYQANAWYNAIISTGDCVVIIGGGTGYVIGQLLESAGYSVQ